MGLCVSVHKETESTIRENGKLLVSSKVKKNPDKVSTQGLTVSDRAIVPQFGNKDETFFDSQPWLDSDCEDDFLSVNGDFTPSQGSTPVHPSFSAKDSKVNEDTVMEGNLSSTPVSSSSDKKRRLSELFKEGLGVDQHIHEENAAVNDNVVPVKVEAETTRLSILPKPTNGTPYLSGANSQSNSDKTPNGVLRADDQSGKSAQCCLPRLLSSRSLSER